MEEEANFYCNLSNKMQSNFYFKPRGFFLQKENVHKTPFKAKVFSMIFLFPNFSRKSKRLSEKDIFDLFTKTDSAERSPRSTTLALPNTRKFIMILSFVHL